MSGNQPQMLSKEIRPVMSGKKLESNATHCVNVMNKAPFPMEAGWYRLEKS